MIDPNAQARPYAAEWGYKDGLTIRQELAARAMQGLLSSWGSHDVTSLEEIASDAVRAADALIAELNKSEE